MTEQAPEPVETDPDITVQLANPIRTSAGDYSPPGVVTLPPDEARELIRSGMATRAVAQ
jgi:hypothetical protein